jgi:hypothetical protein
MLIAVHLFFGVVQSGHEQQAASRMSQVRQAALGIQLLPSLPINEVTEAGSKVAGLA